MSLMYKGPIYRLSAGQQVNYSTEPVSWSTTDWLFEEWESQIDKMKLKRIKGDTGEQMAVSIQGLAEYLKNHGTDIHDIWYWTKMKPEQYFADHPHAEMIAAVWVQEDEVLFPLSSQTVTDIL